MFLIDSNNAQSYLTATGRINDGDPVQVRELAGGVSNIVLHVARRDGEDFVLKQARDQLRVAQPWFCNVERIWREVAVLRLCQRILAKPSGATSNDVRIQTPHVLFEDRENYAFAMTAAPTHDVWKQQLLSGRIDTRIAAACGELMAALHGATWNDDSVARELGDRQFFHDLRVDPYYRHVATVHADLQDAIQRLIDSLGQNCVCLVHGDFSPKNLLVGNDGSLTLIDFEVGHFGDPAFDLGFFISHLVLKAFRAPPTFGQFIALANEFWKVYRSAMSARVPAGDLEQLENRAMLNLAGCLLARVDGKSPVDYLDPKSVESVRQAARGLLQETAMTWQEMSLALSAVLAPATVDTTNRG